MKTRPGGGLGVVCVLLFALIIVEIRREDNPLHHKKRHRQAYKAQHIVVSLPPIADRPGRSPNRLGLGQNIISIYYIIYYKDIFYLYYVFCYNRRCPRQPGKTPAAAEKAAFLEE